MNSHLLSILGLAIFIFLAFGSSETDNTSDVSLSGIEDKSKKANEPQPATTPMYEGWDHYEALERDAQRLTGGGSVIEVALEDSVATIRYTTIYSVYKQNNAQSAVTEGHYNSYWHTGDAISKAIVGAPVNIMRDLYFIKQVNVELETEQELYTFSMTRRQAEQELGRPLTDLATNEAQAKYFADPIIYVDAERERWFNTYGQKKSQKKSISIDF